MAHNPDFPAPGDDKKVNPPKPGHEKRQDARDNVDQANARNDSVGGVKPNTAGSGPVTMTGDTETPLPEDHPEDKAMGKHKPE